MDLIRVSSAEDVRAAVASGGPIVVRGGGTMPGAQASGRVLDTRALDGIPYYEPADLICTCGAGVTLASLQSRLDGQVLPVWHPRAGDATIGGLVAAGWEGLGRQLYGRFRDRVLEVRFVSGEGKVVRGGARVVKNVTGFDLPRLLFGSMGTLGVIVEVTLKVHPRPGPLHGVRVDGIDALRALAVSAPQPVEAIAVRSAGGWSAYAFAPGPDADARALLGAGEAPEVAFEDLATDTLLCPADDGPAVCRATLKPSDTPALAARLQGRAIVDAASGAAWFEAEEDEIAPLRAMCETLVLLRAPDEVRERVGTFGPAPATIDLMRRLKSQFDPGGALGPGRFVV